MAVPHRTPLQYSPLIVRIFFLADRNPQQPGLTESGRVEHLRHTQGGDAIPSYGMRP